MQEIIRICFETSLLLFHVSLSKGELARLSHLQPCFQGNHHMGYKLKLQKIQRYLMFFVPYRFLNSSRICDNMVGQNDWRAFKVIGQQTFLTAVTIHCSLTCRYF